MAQRSRLLSIGLPVLGAASLAGAIYAIAASSPRHVTPTPATLPATAPPGHAHLIGAVGLVETASEQIAVAAEVPGVVRTIDAEPGTTKHKGDVLFAVDDRAARAALVLRQAGVASAQASLGEARSGFADENEQLLRAERLNQMSPSLSMSQDTLMRRRFATAMAEARIQTAQAAVGSATAEVEAAAIAFDRLTVRAPIDGTVLQTNLRVGEFASAGGASPPLVVMGLVTPLHLRTDIDETDVVRFDPAAAAWASPRGDSGRRVALTLVRVDPYVVPKVSLTGNGSERVDTRVLRVVYAFDPLRLAAFPGQLMDVFIDARVIPADPPP